jgi:hypothetical protein
VYCRDCPLYDKEAERCRENKVNPQSWDMAVSVAQVFGLRSICTFNDFKERLVQSRKPVEK